MKTVKRIAIVFAVYVAIVVVFESMIGFFQPAPEGTLVITTRDDAGARHSRVVSALRSDDALYVAANHWPRAWYEQALAHPEVEIAMVGEPAQRRAVPVGGEEQERIEREHALGPVFRVLTGFPPRRFLRLDPR